MKVIDHGKWIPYKPDPLPEGAPSGALFCKRESDGVDWYVYSHPSEDERKRKRLFSSNFQEDSVKIAFMWHESEQQWIIGPTYVDVSMIFPAHHYVREIIDFPRARDEEAVIEAFRNKVINPDTSEIIGDRSEFAQKIPDEMNVPLLGERIGKLEELVKQLLERTK